MGRRHLASASLAALLCIGLAGCGEDSPKPGPVTESTASPSSDPAVDATAVAKNWIDSLNDAGKSLNTRELQSLSSGACSACTSVIQVIQEINSGGGVIKGGQWLDPSLSAKLLTSGEVQVDATVRVTPQAVRRSANGKTVRFSGGNDTPKRLTLRTVNGEWKVVKLEQEDTL